VQRQSLWVGSNSLAFCKGRTTGTQPSPPEIPLQQDAQSNQMPAPDTVEKKQKEKTTQAVKATSHTSILPAAIPLLALVAEHIGKTNGHASPGFGFVAASILIKMLGINGFEDVHTNGLLHTS